MAARGHGSAATAARKDVAASGGGGGMGTAGDGGAAVAERGGQVSVGGPGPPHGAVPPLTVPFLPSRCVPPLTAFSVPPVSPHGLCLHSPDRAAAERAPRIYTRTGDSGRAREVPEAAGRAPPQP